MAWGCLGRGFQGPVHLQQALKGDRALGRHTSQVLRPLCSMGRGVPQQRGPLKHKTQGSMRLPFWSLITIPQQRSSRDGAQP